MKHAVVTGAVVPLFCCSSDLTYGTRTLLKEIVELLPSAARCRPDADPGAARWRGAAPLLGRVFKTVSEPHVGDVTYFRLYRGEMRNGEEVWNAEHGDAEKINHLSVPQGKDRVEVERLMRGRHRLRRQAQGYAHRRHVLPPRHTRCGSRRSTFPRRWRRRHSSHEARRRGQARAALHGCTRRILPSTSSTTRNWARRCIHGMGERHFETILGRIARRYGVLAELARPRIAYRETFRGQGRRPGEAQEADGRSGAVRRLLDPHPAARARGGLPLRRQGRRRRHPEQVHPRRGSRDPGISAARRARRPSGRGFRGRSASTAATTTSTPTKCRSRWPGIQAFRNVAPNCRPVLLEPLIEVETWAPEETLGDVMGDLSARRGQILGTDRDGRLTRVRSIVPAGGTLSLLDRAALDHAWPWHAHGEIPRICGSAAGGHRQGGIGVEGGVAEVSCMAGLPAATSCSRRSRRDAGVPLSATLDLVRPAGQALFLTMWNSVTPADAARPVTVESTVWPVWKVHFAVSVRAGRRVLGVDRRDDAVLDAEARTRVARTRPSAPTELPSSILVTCGLRRRRRRWRCAAAGGGGGASFLHAEMTNGRQPAPAWRRRTRELHGRLLAVSGVGNGEDLTGDRSCQDP